MRLVDQLPSHDDLLLRGSDEEHDEAPTEDERENLHDDWYWDRYFQALVY